MKRRISFILFSFLIVAGIIAIVSGCSKKESEAIDEAKAAGWTTADLPQASVDPFHDMDGGVKLDSDEVRGRNTWMVWTAGNQAFWNYLANRSFGSVDLLKIVSSQPGSKFGRDNRFNYFGLMNEPGFKKPSKPDQYGLWIDERTEGQEPFDEKVYGRSSGVLGLRLFPNPDFDEKAKRKWSAERYYNDRGYYYSSDLVRPYRVGMACAFCHIGPSPTSPAANPEKPEWKNLNAYVGNQYFWIGRVFGYDLDSTNFLWQLFNSSAPGALETSQIATDNINNPRTINSIYNVGFRLKTGIEEEITGGALNIPGTQPKMVVPHVLKDGADAVGILGALSRVYLNIGEFHQEWVKHFNPIVGGKPQTPIEVAVAQKNSVYYQASQERVGNLAKYFLRAALPHHLEDIPEGRKYLTQDQKVLGHGKIVFAENCAKCHSSIQPPASIDPQSPAYADWMRKAVMTPGFRDSNYFSNEKRYPVSLIGTNACASLGSNSMRGHVWDNYSSETYKTLPSVGKIHVFNPIDSTYSDFQMPDGGRGYYRPPTLVSLWTSAPFLHNNSVGKFTNDPSVAGRMAAFDDGIEKLLWPEKRNYNQCKDDWKLPFCPPVYRTTSTSYIVINKDFLPPLLQPLLGWKRFFGMAEEFKIGPIPRGTPVSLLANLNLQLKDSDFPGLLQFLFKFKAALWKIKLQSLDETASTQELKKLAPELLSRSNCPDFVVDRGHEFGSKLADMDKRALIEYLKTL